MNYRVVLLVAGAAGLGLLIGISAVPAQRPAGFRPAVGPFTVAHSTATRVLVLDTATGQVYQVGADDFKRAADLPGMGLPIPRTEKEGPDFRRFKEEKKAFDPDRFKDEKKKD